MITEFMMRHESPYRSNYQILLGEFQTQLLPFDIFFGGKKVTSLEDC